MPAYELKSVIPKIQAHHFNFALYKGEKANQVLITPTPPQPKLITEMEKEIGSAKRLAKGICYFQNDQFIFATKAEVSSMWEPMTTKILKDHQCAKFLPVVYRKLADHESDEVSGTGEAEGGEAEHEETPSASGIPSAPPPPPTAPPPPPAPPPLSEADRLRQAATAMGPRIKAALAAHPDRKAAFSAALADFTAHLNSGDVAQAKQALAALLQKLKEAEGVAGTAPAPTAKGSFVVYTQSRLQWDQARKKVQAELRKLEESILATCKYEDDFEEISAGTKNLYEMLQDLDDRLGDKLDDALNAETPEKRQAIHVEAQKIVAEYLAFVNEDDLIQEIDTNGFVSVAVRSTLTETLNDLAGKLSAPIGQN